MSGAADSALEARTWYDDTAIAPPPTGMGDRDAPAVFDVAIIGAGLAGLTLLLDMATAGQSAVLVEKNTIGAGASGRNGGFCTPGWAADTAQITRVMGAGAGDAMADLAAAGLGWMQARMQRADYASSRPVAGALTASFSGATPGEIAPGETLMTRADMASQLSTERYRYGVFSPVGLHFHPLNFMRCLAAEAMGQGGSILENTALLALATVPEGFSLDLGAAHAPLVARRVVFATGGYGGAENAYLARRLLPIRTYIGVSDPMEALLDRHIRPDWAIADTRRAGNYYRRLHDGRLLWGMAITAFGTLDTARVKQMVLADMQQIYPRLVSDMAQAHKGIAYGWAGNMAYARHFLPYVGQIAPDMFAITGFGGHGMNTAPAAAHALAAHLSGDPGALEPFQRIPRPLTFGLAGKLAAEAIYRWRKYTDSRA